MTKNELLLKIQKNSIPIVSMEKKPGKNFMISPIVANSDTLIIPVMTKEWRRAEEKGSIKFTRKKNTFAQRKRSVFKNILWN